MPTPREAILAALHARLSALAATVLRGDVLPERVPAEGEASLKAAVIPVVLHYSTADPPA